MNNFRIPLIDAILPQLQTLSLQVNQNEYRIRKSGCKGSLWVGKRYDGFRLQTTSEIAALLDKELERLCGREIGEQKGYKYWYTDDEQAVKEILNFYNKG